VKTGWEWNLANIVLSIPADYRQTRPEKGCRFDGIADSKQIEQRQHGAGQRLADPFARKCGLLYYDNGTSKQSESARRSGSSRASA
jgi:hypothetical protein